MPFELTQQVLRSTGESAVPAASELVRYLHASRRGDGSYVTEELLSEINSDALVYRLYLAHLTQVRRYLSAAQQTTLQSPPLPHDRTGQYRLRFCVSNPELVPSGDASVDPGCPIEGLMG